MFQNLLTLVVSVVYLPVYLVLVGADKLKEKLDI